MLVLVLVLVLLGIVVVVVVVVPVVISGMVKVRVIPIIVPTMASGSSTLATIVSNDSPCGIFLYLRPYLRIINVPNYSFLGDHMIETSCCCLSGLG